MSYQSYVRSTSLLRRFYDWHIFPRIYRARVWALNASKILIKTKRKNTP